MTMDAESSGSGAPRAAESSSHYDLVVAGATPGGIACSLRAAREGLKVVLIESSGHVGGMWASGLQGFDTRYAGHRCPILSEFLLRLQEHYRRTFGEGSAELRMASFGQPGRHGERPRFEPHVAERVFREMIDEQPRLCLRTGCRIRDVQVEDRVIRRIQLDAGEAAPNLPWISGDIFADATYEADLAAMAGAPYRIGRESRSEFAEPHAGRHFTTIEPIGEKGRAIAETLNLHFFNRTSRRNFPESSGEGDRAVQAYTLRLTLTDVPANRRSIARPTGYDRDQFAGILDRSPDAHDKGYPLSSHYLQGEISQLRLSATLPNRKTDWLGANFVGRNHDYPDAAPDARRRIYAAHVAHALGTMYFLQHDPAVPAAVRADYGRWGLARDEYVDTGNVPGMMYVREARRLRGRHTFTEHDATRHPRHGRTPIHPDSIAFAEWPMDSHDCNPVRVPGSFNDGELILAEETLPSQIPYRCMVTDAVENLLVPVCLSSTHIGWGTLRLEPVFVHTGEAAGLAAALCQRDNLLPCRLDGAMLQQELLERGVATTYFSDVDLGGEGDGAADLPYLGARGFFCGYVARPDMLLEPSLAAVWHAILCRTFAEAPDPDACAALACNSAAPGVRAPDWTQPQSRETESLLRESGWDPGRMGTVREAARRVRAALRLLARRTCAGWRPPAVAVATIRSGTDSTPPR